MARIKSTHEPRNRSDYLDPRSYRDAAARLTESYAGNRDRLDWLLNAVVERRNVAASLGDHARAYYLHEAALVIYNVAHKTPRAALPSKPSLPSKPRFKLVWPWTL